MLSTIIYLAMGWSIVFAIAPLARSLSAQGLLLLFVGGAFYTIGGIVYAIKKPKLFSSFGFHELFHILVLLGAVSHYFMVYLFI